MDKQNNDRNAAINREIKSLRGVAALIDDRNKGGQLKDISDAMRMSALRLERAVAALKEPQYDAEKTALWNFFWKSCAFTQAPEDDDQKEWKAVQKAHKLLLQFIPAAPQPEVAE